MFDVREHLDGLGCRETGWVRARRDEAVREQRRWRVIELACTAVLDERGALDDDLAARDGVSDRAARETLETARVLESLPAIAAQAYAGALSGEQLAPLAELADASTDDEWAACAPNTPPLELVRQARRQTTPTVEDARARREARHLRVRVDEARGMVGVRGELADIDGILFKNVIDEMADGLGPARGEPWDSRDHRNADAPALLARCWREHAAPADDTPRSGRVKPLFVVHVAADGPAEVAGVPFAHSQIEALLARAHVELVLDDDAGAVVATGRARSVITPKINRAVLLRDAHCRWPGCAQRGFLQVHHLIPRSWDGGDEIANIAAVCTHHHPKLAPQGEWMLVGNPNQPDGLRLTTIAQWLTHTSRPDPRARPPTAWARSAAAPTDGRPDFSASRCR